MSKTHTTLTPKRSRFSCIRLCALAVGVSICGRHSYLVDYISSDAISSRFASSPILSQLHSRLAAVFDSRSISDNQTQLKACEKCFNSSKVLRTSHTRENPNRKFWKCKGCGAFEWDDNRKSSECNDFRGMEDRNMNENKIEILLGEVRKLGHQMECLPLKFQLFEKKLLQRREREAQRQLMKAE